jgi:hypothetical protein
MGEGEPDWNDQIVGRAQQKRSRRSTPFSRPPPSTASVHAEMVVHECVVAALVQEMRLTVPFD